MSTELGASHGIVKEHKERLVKDLTAVVADADRLLSEVTNSTIDGFAATRARFGDKVREVTRRMGGVRTSVTEKAKDVSEVTHNYMIENPWKVLGTVASFGFLLGYLLARR